ncbi:MAG: glycosyltransferase [Anaerolineae bacterium]|nr:glycosyltransferase [Anaerolineae bacterium]
MSAQPSGVMQMIDTLQLGGAERMAVNIANQLPPEHFASHMCITRQNGPLAGEIAPQVQQLVLDRTRRLDLDAFARLRKYIVQHRIRLIHAHGSSLFLAQMMKALRPSLQVIWHAHYGGYASAKGRGLLLGLALQRTDAVFVVNHPLVGWVTATYGLAPDRVRYLPNFVLRPAGVGPAPDLPGTPENRLICVANLRPLKDQLGLVQAMVNVVAEQPEVHLLLVGAEPDATYSAQVRAAIQQGGWVHRFTCWGSVRM